MNQLIILSIAAELQCADNYSVTVPCSSTEKNPNIDVRNRKVFM